MRIAILEHPTGLSAYIGEIFDAWGLCAWSMAAPGALAELDPAQTPVLILPAGAAVNGSKTHAGVGNDPLSAAALVYAQRRRTVVAMKDIQSAKYCLCAFANSRAVESNSTLIRFR